MWEFVKNWPEAWNVLVGLNPALKLKKEETAKGFKTLLCWILRRKCLKDTLLNLKQLNNERLKPKKKSVNSSTDFEI